MTKFNHKIFIPLLLIPVLGLIWHQLRKTDESTLEKKRHQVFLAAAKEINQVWKRGVSQKEVTCQQYFSEVPAPKEWIRCNPHALICLFENENLKIDSEEVKVSFPKRKKAPYKIIYKSQGSNAFASPYALEVKLGWKSFEETLWLEDQCSFVELPKRIFAQGVFKKGKDFKWDSFDKRLFIDRHLVTNREVLEWMQQVEHPKRASFEKKYPVDRFFESSSNLTLKEMHKFCAFRGKKLVEARVLDAASFYFGEEDYSKGAMIFRGPYPWTKKKKGTFIDKYKKDPSQKPSREECLKIPALGCEELSLRDIYNSSATYSGIFQVLGGIPEVVRNPLFPKRNLRVSSNFLPMNSSWHELGKRIYWDGQDHAKGRFSWGFRGAGIDVIPDFIPVGFRCMKEESL